jgi:hypothetical protein
MSNVFNKAREQFLQAGINMNTADIRVMLVLSTYTYDAADEFLADLGAVDNGRSAALGSKTFTDGVFDAANSTLNATAAAASNALVIFVHTGSDATARVIAYINDAVGLPFTPEAAQACPLVWDDGANKIFNLTSP